MKEEIRRNVVRRLRGGEDIVTGVFGYDETIVPQLETALLAAHDVIFLGERGQAKSRMIRGLVDLLDDAMPIVEGSEINDDPYDPVSRYARERIAAEGDETPIAWVGRDERYAEKLATPDISIADLIGEVDPIKVAEGRYLSDELTIHYGLIPRVNRGIFAINELPDLAERIQVGLLNILEERDVQIRGYKVRLPLDIMLVASANPEDYTNRGRIITPLKDRFGSQIRTHYPLETDLEVRIAEVECTPPVTDGRPVHVPAFLRNLVAEISQFARQSPNVNQRSGVSVRMTICNTETLLAAALRRALRNGEDEVVPRLSDLDALIASTAGKVEIESIDEGKESEVLGRVFAKAILQVYREQVRAEDVRPLLAAADEGLVVEVDSETPAQAVLRQIDGLDELTAALVRIGGESPGGIVAALELVLEGLHLSKRLNKEELGGRAAYSAR